MQVEECPLWAEARSKSLVLQDLFLLLSMGFQKSEADPNLYFIMVGDDPLVLLLYVDDFITGRERPIVACKKDLAAEYEMIDIG